MTSHIQPPLSTVPTPRFVACWRQRRIAAWSNAKAMGQLRMAVMVELKLKVSWGSAQGSFQGFPRVPGSEAAFPGCHENFFGISIGDQMRSEIEKQNSFAMFCYFCFYRRTTNVWTLPWRHPVRLEPSCRLQTAELHLVQQM